MDLDDLKNLAAEAESIRFQCQCGQRLRGHRPGANVKCPKCGRVMQVPGRAAGQGQVRFECGCGKHLIGRRPGAQVKCPRCGRVLTVPAAAQPAPQAPKGAARRWVPSWRKAGRWAAMTAVALAAIWTLHVSVVSRFLRRDGRAGSGIAAQSGAPPAAGTGDVAVAEVEAGSLLLEERGLRAEQKTALVIAIAAGVMLLAVAAVVMVRSGKDQRQQRVLLREATELKERGDEFYNRQAFAQAKELYEEALDKLADVADECHVLRGILEELVRSDDIRYGSNPAYQLVEGKWVLRL